MFSFPFCLPIGMQVLLVNVVIVLGITEFPIPGNSIPTNETCVNVSGVCYFKASEEPMEWNDSLRLCNYFNSTLPIIRNTDDQNAIKGYLEMFVDDSTQIWTAGKSFAFGEWSWSNGESLEKECEVRPREFQYGEEDHYAALDTDLSFTALDASAEFPYICQYKGAHCNSSSDFIVNNKCLRLINDSRKWYEARNQCLLTGGDLAVMNNNARRLLKELKLEQCSWVGLRKKSWLWYLNDNVESNEEIKYTDWDSNSYSTHGECIYIDASDGKWKAVGCIQHRAVVCQRGQSKTFALNMDTTVGNTKTKEVSFTLFGSVVAAIAVIICIIVIVVIVVFALRTRERSRMSIYESADAQGKGSDAIPGAYENILLSTLNQTENGATSEQSGIVYAILEHQNKPANLETNQKRANPRNIGPLGDIYATPAVKGQSVTSPVNSSVRSNSHPILITARGDVYALPMKTSKSTVKNRPKDVVYANLPSDR